MCNGGTGCCELIPEFRPDGKKKAYVRLTSDHDALDVANKVRFMVNNEGYY